MTNLAIMGAMLASTIGSSWNYLGSSIPAPAGSTDGGITEDFDFALMEPLESPVTICETATTAASVVDESKSMGTTPPACSPASLLIWADSEPQMCGPAMAPPALCSVSEPRMCVCELPYLHWWNCRPFTTETKETATSGFGATCQQAIANAEANLQQQIQWAQDECEGYGGVFTNLANYRREPGVGQCEQFLPGRPTLTHRIVFDVQCTFGANCPDRPLPHRTVQLNRCRDQYNACLNAGVVDARCWNQYIACIRAVEGR